MNFMSYVAEVSRGCDEPNARDMGRMKSQPNAKGEMYILNDGIDMKAKIAAMARRLEELEMKNMQEVKVVGDFVGAQKSINAQLSQRIDSVEMQEKENSPSQPYENSMSIHEMEAKEGESSQKREVKEVITLRSGKEIDLPTCKIDHKEERSGSQKSNALNGLQIRVEMKKLEPLEADHSKLKANFAGLRNQPLATK
ncbi:hypothetical protein CK203_108955 [Vitis vinifera]|uniref:Uncharacterized protein n=1 Tax=Vitis vinifera TaxID=29760 RepID=A0A438FFN3_VITVI|nr:hypothetical protein CK203_108955 [Vitis vinifera]